MKSRDSDDPYRTVIQTFNRRGIRYVVVGMAGINYYARQSSEMFATLDYDLFLEPTLKNIRQASEALKVLGFTVATSAGETEPGHVAQIVRQRRTLTATTLAGVMVECLLEISGFPFSELARDAATFTVRGVPVKVGRLTKLLKSKQVAARPKDRAFLRRYRALLEDSE